MIAQLLVATCGILHVVFLFLEMVLWSKPLGLKIFRQSREQALASAILASNQGLYNGILAAGLFWSLTLEPAAWARQAQIFFLLSVIVAGVYGALTVNRRIFWVQAFPAVLGMAAVFAAI